MKTPKIKIFPTNKDDKKRAIDMEKLLDIFYDRNFLNLALSAPYGYKYVYINKYFFTIKIPKLEIDYCSECGNKIGSYWVFEEIGIWKTGKKRIKVPKTLADVFNNKKPKKLKISWKRYKNVST